MAHVGTLVWARNTGGCLGARDRAELVGFAAKTAVVDGPHFLAYRLGIKHRFPPSKDFARLRAPHTPAARHACSSLREIAPPFMVNHSLRTYWFSRLLARDSESLCDDELLYVASLAHDVGLLNRPSETSSHDSCFSIRGAEWASKIARQAGWPAGRRDRLEEAITLNLNGRVPARMGEAAHLMMRGVLLDVAGLYAWRINPSDVREVFDQLPLLDQRQCLWPMFRNEAQRHPQCRAHFAVRWLGFGLLMRHSPWVGDPVEGDDN